MPRLNRLRKVLAGVRAPEPVTVPPKQPRKPQEKREFTPPNPAKYSPHQQSIYEQFVKNVDEGRPHFVIGGKEVYLPWAPVTLLRPSAKMTPYQSQFQVPRHFNKLDLRDYLWHLYGLRALNVTTQIKWSEWVRSRMSRYRTPQVKKMIVEMEQPFIWPARDFAAEATHRKESALAFDKFQEEMGDRQGSDLKKPSKAFDGILGPYPDPPRPYVPAAVRARMSNARERAQKQAQRREELDIIAANLK